MKLRFVLFWGMILLLMVQSGCDVVEAPEEKVVLQGANIRGTVVRSDTQAPISGALVYDSAGLPRDTSKADGSFLLKYDIRQRYSGRLVARKDGFDGDSIDFTLNPGFDTTVTFRLKERLFQVPPSAREPAQIAFISASTSDIFVSGVGALENAILTYEVRDSLGTPIDSRKRAFAVYSINFYPHTSVPGGTAPRLIPSADSTDNAGRLRVNITSGTQAGVAQVVVRINTRTGGTIMSQPVRIGINSGFPDQRHFTLSASNYNFPGLDRFNQRLDITVQVADKYSNPVQSGTVVYFSTTHGSIQTQGAVTGADGFVTKQLISGRPTPEGIDALPGLGPGYSYIKAQTIGENGTFVSDSILVLWTGSPIITKLDTLTSFTVPNGGGAGPFRFRVADRYNHPMSAGTSITTTADAALVTGDALVVMRDTFVTGSGTTDFVVIIRDTNPNDTDPPTPSILKVTVVHPVYGTFTLVLATGTVD